MEVNINIGFRCRELLNAAYIATKKLKVMENLVFKGMQNDLSYVETSNAQVRGLLKNYGIDSSDVVLGDSYKELVIKVDSS